MAAIVHHIIIWEEDFMRIVIVEDEPKTKEGLVRIITKYTNHEICGMANNGLEGMGIIKKLKPDFVISDIQMPEMDGLTMLHKLEEDGEKVYAVVLTGYSNFEYARKALHLGVIDYILKPIEIDNFISTLKEIENKIHKEKMEKVTVGQIVWSLMTTKQVQKDQLQNQLQNALQVNEKIQTSLFLIKPDSLDKETTTEMMHSIENTLDSLCVENFHVVQLSMEFGILVLVIDTEKNKHIVSTFTMHVLSKLSVIGDCYCSYSNIYGLDNFEQTIYELKGLFIYSFVFERDIIIEKDIVNQLKFSDIEYPIHMENRIRKEIKNGNYEKAIEIGMQYKRLIIDSNGSPEYIREYTTRFASTICNIAKEYSSELETKHIFHYYINNIIESKSKRTLTKNYEKILNVVLSKNDTQLETENKIVMKVINYIRENYNSEITLSETAELVGVTPEYLSKLFYQEMNTNFVVFIKNFRIGIAKRMILSGKYHIYEIAGHVGIKDPKYFNKVFKSVCGVTPSEYKKVI